MVPGIFDLFGVTTQDGACCDSSGDLYFFIALSYTTILWGHKEGMHYSA